MAALLKVNGENIDVPAAVRLSILHNATFLRETIRLVMIRQYAQKRNIRNSDAELQLAADELRYHRGLESVQTTEQWMRENHQTPLTIQEGIDAMLLNNKVRNAIAEDAMQAHYAEHKLEYEAAELYSIRVESESKAKELLAQLNDEGANFHVLAMDHSQDENTRHMGGYVGRLTRSQMTGVVAAAVFASRPAAVIGPVKTEQGWNLFKVTKIHRPTYDESKDRVRVALMEQLVNKLIAEAKIEYPVFAEEAGRNGLIGVDGFVCRDGPGRFGFSRHQRREGAGLGAVRASGRPLPADPPDVRVFQFPTTTGSDTCPLCNRKRSTPDQAVENSNLHRTCKDPPGLEQPPNTRLTSAGSRRRGRCGSSGNEMRSIRSSLPALCSALLRHGADHGSVDEKVNPQPAHVSGGLQQVGPHQGRPRRDAGIIDIDLTRCPASLKLSPCFRASHHDWVASLIDRDCSSACCWCAPDAVSRASESGGFRCRHLRESMENPSRSPRLSVCRFSRMEPSFTTRSGMR